MPSSKPVPGKNAHYEHKFQISSASFPCDQKQKGSTKAVANLAGRRKSSPNDKQAAQ
jgi:hypothetical protein